MFTSISPDGIVGSVVRGNTFSVNITATLTPDPLWMSSSLVSVVIVPSFDIGTEPNLTITNGVSTASISGQYSSRFNDVIKYISPCSSDKIETPITVIGLGNLPEGKQVFEFIQDVSVQQYDVSYTVNVTFNYTDDLSNPFTDTESHIITHQNKNDWTQPGVDLKAYLDRNTFGNCNL